MITSLVLIFAISPAPSIPSAVGPGSPDPIVAVERAFNGRARVHRVRTARTAAGLSVTGMLTAPTPFPLSTRGVVVEAIDAAGEVIATVKGTVAKTPAVARRRQPVSVSFKALIPDLPDAVRLRVRPS